MSAFPPYAFLLDIFFTATKIANSLTIFLTLTLELKLTDFISMVFTALHVMQTRYCDEISVRLSVTCVDCDKTEERSFQIFIPYEKNSAVSLR